MLDRGVGEKLRIGMAALSGNQTTEYEFRKLLNIEGVAFFVSRLPDSTIVSPETLRETEQHLASAVSLILPGLPLDVVAFTCTSATIVNGEDRIFARIREVRPGIACTTPITAAMAAMSSLGLKRIALLTPYVESINTMMRSYIEERNVSVPIMGSFLNPNDSEVARITGDSIEKAVRNLVARGGIDGVFVSCGSLRMCEFAETLEAEIGLPVFSSNLAMAWHCLRLGNIRDEIPQQGSLFRTQLRDT
ncbi:Asp/Glu racemase [Ochrobactrum sp. XJ1]|nr:Asp/Glu racemase [Ochrobactrum sp. XJ1]